ncbi:PAS domain-containing protein [Dyadobacter sp. CY326]|uniref:PAS domain-containing sensor histidine kinase n=1 Tax=Dyadobacter sp. CY326 TaxID=2907300 RepID=UPI001F1DB17E|nr:PAS domain-containing protein [Dyadobacter sp. CY326]MCE7066954.1 PAS domain-containing protein [Dyadobacter sp. CY326]
MGDPSKPFNTDNASELLRLELALESAGIGTWELDFQTNQVRWCRRAKKLFRYAGENIIDLQELIEQIDPKDRNAFRTEIERATHSRATPNPAPASFSLEFRTIDDSCGDYCWLLCKGQLHVDAETNDARLSGTFIDVTKQVEDQLLLKEQQKHARSFQTIVEQAPMAIGLLKGPELVIELANEPMISYWGKDASVIGKPLRDAIPELEGQPFLDILDNILITGEEYSSKGAKVLLEVGGKMETFYFDFTYKPIFNSDGEIYGIINMSIDVTDQLLAKKALEESESKLRTVIASAPAAIGLFVGRDLRVELPNQAFIDIVGKGPDIIGVPLRGVMPELESQPFLQILDDVYTTGVTYKSFGTQVNIVQQGVMTQNYYDITYSPVYDNEGKVYAILDIAIDVTERVSIEKQIEESQMQLLALFEQSPIGIAIIQQEDLRFAMANPFYGKLVGRKPEDIVGKPLLEALPEIKGQGFDILLRGVMATGIPFLAKEQPVDIMLDGVLQKIYVDMAYQPQRDREGNIVGVLVVATDLTEQVVSRKKIEETEAFLRGAIELAQLGTFSIDLQTDVMYFSDRMRHWFALEKDELINFKKAYDAISKADLPAVQAAVNQAIAPDSDGLYDMEYAMDRQKTGYARVLHAQGKVFYDENGKPTIMIGTAQDVTQQRKVKLALEMQVQERTEQLESMNEELAAINEEYLATNEELSDSNNRLQQSNVNLQQFAYVASHDLQEPLRKIQTFSNLLATRYSPVLGEGIDYLHRMQAAAKRMSELINDLLEFSHITSQKDAVGTVSLDTVIKEILNDLELSVTESGAVISVASLPDVLGDKTQLSQLFLNLLSNALKFKKPDVQPIIDITCELIFSTDLPASLNVARPASSYHKIAVSDNGIGFDQQYADRIFQLFQRLHGRSEYSGTGIGLAICERVAASHGGGISVVSEPGIGTTFSVFFPFG